MTTVFAIVFLKFIIHAFDCEVIRCERAKQRIDTRLTTEIRASPLLMTYSSSG